MYAVDTIPMCPPYTRWKISAIVSTLGSSNGSSEVSAYTDNALTVDLCPVYKALAELAESVMNESMECVIWCLV